MADRAWVEAKKTEYGVDVLICGRSGDDALRDLEDQLAFKLNDQVADFVRTVGNAGIGGFIVTIAGSEDGLISALTETEAERQYPTIPPHLLKIMDNGGGTCHFLDLRSGEVIEYDSHYILPGQELRQFGSFDEFLTSVFELAKEAEEWGRKHWPEGHQKPSGPPAGRASDLEDVPPELQQQIDEQFESLRRDVDLWHRKE